MGLYGWYEAYILPRAIDKVMDTGSMNRLRGRVTEGLSGEVLEIGFGSGLNLPYYPDAVTNVLAVEPSLEARKIAAPRVEAFRRPVDFIAPEAEALPLPDDSIDSALSTWTLCTIPDLTSALAELQRVLRPGGVFRFVEHGRAHAPKLARWQNRLNPIQRCCGGGCNLNRPIAMLLEASGFHIERVEHFHADGFAPFLDYTYLGTARVRT